MKKELIGRIGVDSGQVMVVDPCYLDEWIANKAFEKSDFSKEFSYNQACLRSCSKLQVGVLGDEMAVVSSTAWGDGTYPVYAIVDERKYGNRKIMGLVISFDESLDEEEYL